MKLVWTVNPVSASIAVLVKPIPHTLSASKNTASRTRRCMTPKAEQYDKFLAAALSIPRLFQQEPTPRRSYFQMQAQKVPPSHF